MNKCEVINLLIKKGYTVSEQQVNKNGITYTGLCFSSPDFGGIAPIINLDTIVRLTEAELVRKIDEIAFETKRRRASANAVAEILNDKNRLLSNVKISLQRCGALPENVVKRPSKLDAAYNDYMFISVNMDNITSGIVKINKDMVKDIDLDVLWTNALCNTIAEARAESLGDMLGLAESMDMGLIAISNKANCHGAGCIYAADRLLKKGSYVAIPSSIHEWIVFPYTDDVDLEKVTEMIREVNETQVAPEERLGSFPTVFAI